MDVFTPIVVFSQKRMFFFVTFKAKNHIFFPLNSETSRNTRNISRCQILVSFLILPFFISFMLLVSYFVILFL